MHRRLSCLHIQFNLIQLGNHEATICFAHTEYIPHYFFFGGGGEEGTLNAQLLLRKACADTG
ncbi:hypothetical protein T4E_12363 [Trichinella pseudospiralis]|uniref:Uncharacterized protein n=1 Tax=Trichinella pseudospiralis TaxID=6337 RepID=A0A0V0XHP0_TRIPS|nr:hypothetical protein T4E_929 [Trichinella pseudospiralis]KRY00997.1 hypothetical protein T4E_12363 [Trichinella pseudospiralis]